MKRRRPIIDPIAAPAAISHSPEAADEDPAPCSPVARHLESPCPPAQTAASPQDAASLLDGASTLAAQLMGQGGRKRGLKGGPPVLQAAKSAYLEAEYSGPNDRRARTGRLTQTEI